MANVRSANSFYIDTQSSGASDNLEVKGVAIFYIAITATSANGRLVLQDTATVPVNKVDLRVPTSGNTEIFEFDMNPILFPNGIKPSTLTNAIATVIFKENNR